MIVIKLLYEIISPVEGIKKLIKSIKKITIFYIKSCRRKFIDEVPKISYFHLLMYSLYIVTTV